MPTAHRRPLPHLDEAQAMHAMLRQLTRDHTNLTRLMEVLEKQLDDFHTGEEHDIDLMCELVEYVESYEDQVHHPTEDLVFARIKAATDAKRTAVETLEEQHRILTDMTKQLRNALEAIMQGGVVLRHDVEAKGRAMLKMLKQHMDLEENEVFVLADEVLNEADWDAVVEQAPKFNDPVFGDPDPARFRTLFMHLSEELGLQSSS
jgi:hemerythrin-like domain-containing protein